MPIETGKKIRIEEVGAIAFTHTIYIVASTICHIDVLQVEGVDVAVES